jgi:hypothetical protein
VQLVDERCLMAQEADGDAALRDALRVLRSLLINITFTFLPFNYFFGAWISAKRHKKLGSS